MDPREIVLGAVRVGLEEIINLRRAGETGGESGASIGDLKTGEVIVAYLRERLGPEAVILVEETAKGLGLRPSQADVVVDPVDSSQGFKFALPWFGTMIGFLESGKLLAGGIGLVICNGQATQFLSDVYLGYLDDNHWVATLNGSHIATTEEKDPRNANVFVELGAFDTCPENFQDGVRLTGELLFPPREGRSRWPYSLSSSSFGFASLARGAAGVMTGSRKPWDILPALPVILGAGAEYFLYKDSLGVLHICAAANPDLFDYAFRAHERAGMTILSSQDYLLFEIGETVF